MCLLALVRYLPACSGPHMALKRTFISSMSLVLALRGQTLDGLDRIRQRLKDDVPVAAGDIRLVPRHRANLSRLENPQLSARHTQSIRENVSMGSFGDGYFDRFNLSSTWAAQNTQSALDTPAQLLLWRALAGPG